MFFICATNFRSSMVDNKGVVPLSVSDNPPEKAPPYPGKFCRNNKDGVTMTKEEWLQEQALQWVKFMQEKPAYTNTYLANKARLLLAHFSRCSPTKPKMRVTKSYPGKVDNYKCRQVILKADAQIQHQRQQQQLDQMSNSDVEIGGLVIILK